MDSATSHMHSELEIRIIEIDWPFIIIILLQICPSNLNYARPNLKNGWKMADGQLL